MGSTIKDFYSGVVLATLLALASCDRGVEQATPETAAVTTSIPAAASPDASEASDDSGTGDGGGERTRAANETARHKDGAPLWSSNSQRSARENAERAFARNGEAFGAKTVDEFIDKAHAFVGDPPQGTLTLTRDNGDKLFYDPKGNTFAVATRDGAPRTMFKPDDGMAYWRQQERSVAERRTGGDRG